MSLPPWLKRPLALKFNQKIQRKDSLFPVLTDNSVVAVLMAPSLHYSHIYAAYEHLLKTVETDEMQNISGILLICISTGTVNFFHTRFPVILTNEYQAWLTDCMF